MIDLMKTLPSFEEIFNGEIEANRKVKEAVEMLDKKNSGGWDQAKWLSIPLHIRLAALKVRLEKVSMMTQSEFVGGEI